MSTDSFWCTDFKPQDVEKPHLPERLLLVAALHRACRDLGADASRIARANAIAWFNCPPIPAKEKRCLFSFVEICDILEFSAKEVAHIQSKVHLAELMNMHSEILEVERAKHDTHVTYRHRVSA